MNFTLKNEEQVEIREIQQTKFAARDFRNYIGAIILERPQAYIRRDSVPSLETEEKWLQTQKTEVRKKNALMLVAFREKKIIGSAGAHRGACKDSDKVSIGISVAKKYRGQGLGRKLLIEIIKLINKRLKPRVVYLTCVADNVPAIKLYKKIGFKEIARLPKWMKVRGKYCDYILMRLK